MPRKKIAKPVLAANNSHPQPATLTTPKFDNFWRPDTLQALANLQNEYWHAMQALQTDYNVKLENLLAANPGLDDDLLKQTN